MIDRYNPECIANIWTTSNKYKTWLYVELSAMLEMENLGIIPKGTFDDFQNKVFHLDFDVKCAADCGIKSEVERIGEIEKEVKHDFIAFTKFIQEVAGPSANFFHFGLTSSDIVDTAFAVNLRDSADTLIKLAKDLYDSLNTKAVMYANTPMIGRSHGMFAEPITFGVFLNSHLAECGRSIERLNRAKDMISYGKLSGTVGVYSQIPAQVEIKTMERIGLKPETVSTQIIPRDRHAEFFSLVAIVGASIERLATNIRHLQRSEVNEVYEPFSESQRGSSAMPHKRNPIISENLCGLSRMLRSNAMSAFENVALWHERDISHSSVERIIAPDSTALLAYMLEKANYVISKLNVNEEIMIARAVESNHARSQSILLELIKRGANRYEAYRWVQKAAHDSGDFVNNLKNSLEIGFFIKPEEIDKIGNLKDLLKNSHEGRGRIESEYDNDDS